MIDILVQPRRDQLAAQRFFRELLKGQQREPRRLVTDKLRSYEAARHAIMPSVVHDTERYANNRAKFRMDRSDSERQMRGFKSVAQAQRFWSVHGVIQNLSESDTTCYGRSTIASYGLVPSLFGTR